MHNLRVLVGVDRPRLGEHALKQHHARFRGLRDFGRRSPDPRHDQDGRRPFPERVELSFDHRQAVLFASERRRVRLELLPEARQRREVGARLLGELAHVRFFRAPQPAFEIGKPGLAGVQLLREERRRVFGAGFARLRVLVYEDRRHAVRHALRAIRLRIQV